MKSIFLNYEAEGFISDAISILAGARQCVRVKCTTYISILCVSVTLLGSFSLAYAEIENLDQVLARKARYSVGKAGWNASLLANPANNYIWQPETLNYTDILTNSEVWMLTRAPDTQEYTSKEHGVNAWSFDGSRIGFYSTNRPVNDPNIISDYHRRWLVNSDGSNMRVALGYGRKSDPLDGFGWAHTENAYYATGSGAGDASSTSTPAKIYKNIVGPSNVVTGSLVFDTSTINLYNKELIKDGVSQDDNRIVVRDNTPHSAGTPNPINTTEMYFIDLTANPVTATHWGIARGIGPVADPYSDHTSAAEISFHDVWSPGPSKPWIMGDYSGVSSLFVTMNVLGTYADGGPAWSDWNGTSFGEIRVESNGTVGIPSNPYGIPYFGHPAFDRWGRFALIGTYTDPQSLAGTRLWDSTTHTLLPNYMMKGTYDGQHHSMTAWSDHVAMVDPTAVDLYGNIITGNETTRYKVASLHFPGYSGNYNGYPRPSQSPDGTKIQYHMDWLNNSGDDYPNIAFSVAYYPYPPEIKTATKSGASVRLTWDFNQGTISAPNYTSSRTYTKRGWPNESADLPPSPREIKQFRVWSSDNNSTWTPLGLIPYNNRGGKWTEISWTYDATQSVNSTRYYAVTSLEHSGLESRSLSNVWKVTLDADGNITQQLQESGYPSAPGGKSSFYTTAPPSIMVQFIHKEAPATADGQYVVKWNAPMDASMIRYYNIYAKDGGAPLTNATPLADRQKFRIASIPASSDYANTGAFRYIDWLGAADGSTKYVITAVDYQGNETRFVDTPAPVQNVIRVTPLPKVEP